MIVSCVLRRSLAFGPEHVRWLGRQVAQHMPEAQFIPFTDCDVGIYSKRLGSTWPSWWAKMEALARLPEGDVLMLDLDTVILKPWDMGLWWNGECAMPRSITPGDVRPWGCWQLSTYAFRQEVAAHFAADPERHVAESEGCDQRYYVKHFNDRIQNARMLWPDAIVSYKLQVAQHGLWPDTSFVLWHGMPRPWDVTADWIPPLKEAA